MANFLINIKKLIFISRPLFWLLFGYLYWLGATIQSNGWDFYSLAGLFFATLPMGIIIFGINDICDAESDALNPRKGGIEGKVLKQNDFFMVKLATIISAVSFLLIFIIGQRYLSALALVGITIISILYSAKPWRLKAVPIVDSLVNGGGTVLVFLMGYYSLEVGLNAPSAPLHQILIILFTTVAVHAMSTLLDYDVDKKAGDRTIGIYLGMRWTSVLSFILLLACFFMINPGNYLLKIFYGLCMALVLTMVISPNQKSIDRIKKLYLIGVSIVIVMIVLRAVLS